MICPRCGFRAEFDEVGKRTGLSHYFVKVECQRCFYVWEHKVNDKVKEQRNDTEKPK